MPGASDEVRSLLKNVELEGAIIIHKKKLLWLLGWSNDKPNAWRELLDHWVEMGNERLTLHGLEINDRLVLTGKCAEYCEHKRVTYWAEEEEESNAVA